MDYIALIKEDLGKGYSKADLERLIGLPKNSLSNIVNGKKKLSKKSELKIEIWEKSSKPSPIEVWATNSINKNISDRIDKAAFPELPKISDFKAIGVVNTEGVIEPLLRFNKPAKIAKRALDELKADIRYKEPDASAFDGKKFDKYVSDEFGQMGNNGDINRDTWRHTDVKVTEHNPDTPTVESQKAAFEEELKHLGTGQFGKQRRKFIEEKIKSLKK